MAKGVTKDDIDLLDDLGVETTPASYGTISPREQRIIAGFEEITRFIAEHGRLPGHGENRDIFERIYATRLDSIRKSAECREVLKCLDTDGLLDITAIEEDRELDDLDLLANLGVDASPGEDLTKLVNVRSQDEIKFAEEIAQRSPCKDFAKFVMIFEQTQVYLESGKSRAIKYRDNAEISKGDIFILGGQKVLVAEIGKWFTADHGRRDARLRVIYDNATESDLLLRSLQRALNKDTTSRRIVSTDLGPLFSGIEEEGDTQTGHIYILRSKSDHPFIAEHRNVIHKIGVTGGDIHHRIASARKDPTYLLADVEIVASFKLANINRKALEGLIHKFFSDARLDLELKDRFGIGVEPREWFLIPLPVIEEAIERFKEGTIGNYRYDRETAVITLDE